MLKYKNVRGGGWFVFIIIFFIADFIFTKIYLFEPLEKISIKHPVYHHDFKKNFYAKSSIFGEKLPITFGYLRKNIGRYEIYTNSLGFKDSSNKKIELDSQKKRILFIGDSFTEGVFLNYQDTFVGIVDEVYKKKNIEVLNAGKTSYSPIIYYKKIEYLINIEKLKFDEVILFLDISDIHDELYYDLDINNNVINRNDKVIKYNLVKFNFKKSLTQNFLVTSQLLFNLWSIFLKNEESEEKYKKEITKEYYNVIYSKHFNKDKWIFSQDTSPRFDQAVNNSLKYLDKLKLLLDKNNINLIVVVYPWPSNIFFNDLESKYVKIWDEWTKKNSVRYINLFPFFININSSNNEKYHFIKKHYFESDIHFNKFGNKFIAEKILLELNY